jgi:hypothetical protein
VLDREDCVEDWSSDRKEEQKSNYPVKVSHAEGVEEIRPNMIKRSYKGQNMECAMETRIGSSFFFCQPIFFLIKQMTKVKLINWKIHANVIDFHAEDKLKNDVVDPPAVHLMVSLSNPEFYLFSTGIQ